MKGKSNYNSIDYSYVFSAKKKLELEHSKKSTTNFGRMKNKWTAAAAIALASGSVVLFVPTGNAQAAEADASVKTEKVETNKHKLIKTLRLKGMQIRQTVQLLIKNSKNRHNNLCRMKTMMIKLIKIHQINL